MTARILAYHRLSDEPCPGLAEWSVRPASFRRQMKLVRRMGYRGVTVRDLLEAIESGADTGKLIGLSFDDGYRDTVEIALPALRDLGFTATVYIVPEYIGGVAAWEPEGSRARLADWAELTELVEAGWEIGMHTRSHPPRFDLLQGQELQCQICGGLPAARAKLRTPIETFAYPHGNHSTSSAEAVREAGFRWAVSTRPGPVRPDSPPFALPRYEIKRRDTLVEFGIMMLTGVLPRRRASIRLAGRRRG